MDYEIKNKLIFITLTGVYPVHELIGLIRAALDDPEATIPARILIDASLSKAIRSSEEIERIATTISNWKPEIKRIAVFVTSDIHYGSTRVGTALSNFSSLDVAPFRSYDDALSFLTHDL